MNSLIISLHGNVNNSRFIKQNSPESRPATPLNLTLLCSSFWRDFQRQIGLSTAVALNVTFNGNAT